MTTFLLIAGFVLFVAGLRAGASVRHETPVEREKRTVPNEDSPVRDLNRRRPVSQAAVLNLSRAVRRIH